VIFLTAWMVFLLEADW